MKSFINPVIIMLMAVQMHSAMATTEIKFARHKTESGELERSFLEQLSKIFLVDIFVETGTYMGNTTANALPFFSRIDSIELSPELFKRAIDRFKSSPTIHLHQGNSSEVFKKLLPTLKGTVLFFLDAHYSGKGTAMGAEGSSSAKALTPIRQELQAIADAHVKNCIILIDDIRIFGAKINEKEYIADWAYPSIADLLKMLFAINPNFEPVLIGDMLLAYDKTIYQPPLSPLIKAFTASRFFDGANYTEQELAQAEELIIKTSLSSDEQAIIDWIYNGTILDKPSKGQGNCFYHLLWKALSEYRNNPKHAYELFNEIAQLYNAERIKNYLTSLTQL